jgi:hypothetical protein
MASTYRAVEISSPGVFSLVERKVAVLGAGQVRIRRAELTHLKVTDVDSQRMVIHIHGGKGRKDRDYAQPGTSRSVTRILASHPLRKQPRAGTLPIQP